MPLHESAPEPDVYVIAERGTEWGACIEEVRARGRSAHALIQSPFEPLGAFVARVRARLVEAPPRGACATTVLLGETDSTPAAVAARGEVIGATREAVGAGALRVVVTSARSAERLGRALEGCDVELRGAARVTRPAPRRVFAFVRGERAVA